ncbi:hypothetical protein NHX12_024883 [Muraenolepis orangiensis]|uniref:Endonuclease/exonuclease/phosphatase domain-containing protein n=1 Tax=Muraenolepis orangiensis TaxID=630683 RepID=A0A9Q0ENZ9_9TELE|nr:hypothetical protein NHX12_024883 [Muraenolepis orangiensis]
MATYNANTVREEARLEELANCVEERGVEILGVQEHRRVHTDQPILYHKVGGCSFITSSAWRNDAQAATGGVGLMVSPRARRALRRVQQHTNRILVADFEGNPVTTVMSVYSPTNAAPIEDVEKFYDELRTAIHHVPAHNFLVILGDFNARLGPEDAPFTYHNNTNRNGEYLSALLTEHELLAANTLFRKRMGKRWTFQDRASGMLRQLDYILWVLECPLVVSSHSTKGCCLGLSFHHNLSISLERNVLNAPPPSVQHIVPEVADMA